MTLCSLDDFKMLLKAGKAENFCSLNNKKVFTLFLHNQL